MGDASHPTPQCLAQGACMALEDEVTLGEALLANGYGLARARRLALLRRHGVAVRPECGQLPGPRPGQPA